MNGMLEHMGMTIRLYFRNRMALIYGYLFPVVFLFAFYVYYMSEPDPLRQHLGELLAVTALSGVCFGLPTTLVSERERGVWRRYKLSPMPTRSLVASTIAARYLTTVTAGLLQVLIGLAFGMAMPNHPLDLFIAFSFVCFAFVGMGLVVATMADTVPAVQALGQCLFLPLLMIGGVAVSLASLPAWAQHISAFFPGRYAVQAMNAAVRGDGIFAYNGARFSLIALTIIGCVAIYAGTKLFRWDSQQRFAIRDGKGWLAVALSGWVLVGLAAEWKGRVLIVPDGNEIVRAPRGFGPITKGNESPAVQNPVAPSTPPLSVPAPNPGQAQPTTPAANAAATPSAAAPATPQSQSPASPTTPGAAAAGSPPSAPAVSSAEPWRNLTKNDWWGLPFADLPPDAGVEAPIAAPNEETTEDVNLEVEALARALPRWPLYAEVKDPVQRVRNALTAAVVPDAAKWTTERFVPWAVFERLEADFPREDLLKILTYIALNPKEGSVEAALHFQEIGPALNPPSEEETRIRSAWYAMKFVGAMLGVKTP